MPAPAASPPPRTASPQRRESRRATRRPAPWGRPVRRPRDASSGNLPQDTDPEDPQTQSKSEAGNERYQHRPKPPSRKCSSW